MHILLNLRYWYRKWVCICSGLTYYFFPGLNVKSCTQDLSQGSSVSAHNRTRRRREDEVWSESDQDPDLWSLDRHLVFPCGGRDTLRSLCNRWDLKPDRRLLSCFYLMIWLQDGFVLMFHNRLSHTHYTVPQHTHFLQPCPYSPAVTFAHCPPRGHRAGRRIRWKSLLRNKPSNPPRWGFWTWDYITASPVGRLWNDTGGSVWTRAPGSFGSQMMEIMMKIFHVELLIAKHLLDL